MTAKTIQNTSNVFTMYGIIGLLLFIFLYVACAQYVVFHLMHITQINAASFYVTRFIFWIYLGLLFIYSHKVESTPLLLWKERQYSMLTYFLSILALLVILFIGSVIINLLISSTGHVQKSDRMQEILAVLRTNKILLIFTALTAGVVEELIFRGYLQPRFEQVFKKPWIAMSLSALCFGLLHYSFGTLINVIVPIFIGFIFALCYSKYRNIKLLIICHFLWDFIVLMIQMK